jgi:hypothetical protein
MKIFYIILFILISLIPVSQYIYWENSVNEGYYFAPAGDIAIYLSLMKSYDFGFENPWGYGNVLIHPAFVSSHVFFPYWLLMSFTGIGIINAYAVFEFLCSIALCFSLYFFADTFSINKKYFFFFAFFVAGVGGWLTLPGFFEKGQMIGYGFNFLRMLGDYRSLAFSCSLLGVSFIKKKKDTRGLIFLFLSGVIHPVFGLAGLVIYWLLNKEEKFMKKIRKSIFVFVPIAIQVAAWFSSEAHISSMNYNAAINSVFLPSIILSLAIPMFFVYFKERKTFDRFFLGKKSILWILSFVGISWYGYSSSFWTGAQSVSYIFAVPFAALLLFVAIKTYSENMTWLSLFFTFLLLILLPLGFTSRWFSYLALFLSILASQYLPNLNKKTVFAALCIIISLPSLYFYYDFETNTRIFDNKEMYYTNITSYDGFSVLNPYDGMRVPYLFGKRYLNDINRDDVQMPVNNETLGSYG